MCILDMGRRDRSKGSNGRAFGNCLALFHAKAGQMPAWSATAAALAFVLQAGFLADIMLKETKTTGYETASAPSTDPGVGAFTLIRFAPQASFR
jgi:hypothetical protein